MHTKLSDYTESCCMYYDCFIREHRLNRIGLEYCSNMAATC